MKSVLFLIVCSPFLASCRRGPDIRDQRPAVAARTIAIVKPTKNGQPAQSNASGENGMGWGSSIEVGRLARAAEDALRRGNPSAAADYADRAVKAAPQDNKLWFLLGYTSRLAGRYQTSVEAYQHGLANRARKCRRNERPGADLRDAWGAPTTPSVYCCRSFAPIRIALNDLLVAGELYMKTGDAQEGINLLQRAESQQPNAHAELMLAIAYLKLKQPDRAKQMLDQAQETCAGQCRDLSGGGKLLSRRARLQGGDHHAEERAAHDSVGARRSRLHLRARRRQATSGGSLHAGRQ